MAVNVEDAGFEIRDQIMWVYGSGFPKSLNVGKAVDKKLGNERDVVGVNPNHRTSDALYELGFQGGKSDGVMTKGTSEWEGWGTALKPAHEPIVLARKPFRGDVASNVLEHGTGALNIDSCRVETTDSYSYPNGPKGNSFSVNQEPENKRNEPVESNPLGRWPANFIHDGLEEEWSKYFYCAKASKQDRNEGCEDLEEKEGVVHIVQSANRKNAGTNKTFPRANHHPTVKPTELMRYLCRLITPKDGIVLDPFMGSGSTGKAAILEGFSFIGIELSEEYLKIAQKRCQETIK
jgi:site-specific DNA-methyltransferase (adenine-specific)